MIYVDNIQKKPPKKPKKNTKTTTTKASMITIISCHKKYLLCPEIFWKNTLEHYVYRIDK